MMALRVGYDAQAFLSPNGGTGKGLQLRNLLGPFVDQFIGFASAAPNASGLPLVQEGASRYNLWQQVSLPLSLRRHKVDLFLAPCNTAPFLLPSRTRLVLVLHDLILMKGYRKASLHGRLMDTYRRSQIGCSVAQAQIILTVSEHARCEILERFPNAHVRVIPCTIPAEWFRASPLRGRDGYLLMVTSSAPHKNAEGAIAAYARYAHNVGAKARPLNVVGLSREAPHYKNLAAQLQVSGLLQFLPFVSDRELRDLYHGAAALLLPSFAEGFGIPMLEAMATGTPVIASRAASLPEVGADAAYYFDPSNITEIAAAVATVLGDDHLRAEMADKGVARARYYHPDSVGRLVTDFWQEVAGVTAACPAAV